MLRTLALLAVCSLPFLNMGCSTEKKPKADPNWKTSTDPSDIVIPDQMKKMPPAVPRR